MPPSQFDVVAAARMAAWPMAVFVLSLTALLLVRRLAIRRLFAHTKNGHPVARAALQSARLPSFLWCLAAALSVTLSQSAIPESIALTAGRWILAFLILSMCMAGSSITIRALEQYGDRLGVEFAASGLAHAIIRVLYFGFGGVMLLWLFGKAVTPALTALGVGGLAVAWALQDTLANFFAGIHVMLERPIAVGHTVKLSEAEQGVVTDIGWRTTRLVNGLNAMIVVPNSKITSAILINNSLPSPMRGVDVELIVAHEADADQVREIALQEVRETPGALAEPAPFVMFHPGFRPSHLELTLRFFAVDSATAGVARSEVRFRIHRRFRQEGIPLPRVPAA